MTVSLPKDRTSDQDNPHILQIQSANGFKNITIRPMFWPGVFTPQLPIQLGVCGEQQYTGWRRKYKAHHNSCQCAEWGHTDVYASIRVLRTDQGFSDGGGYLGFNPLIHLGSANACRGKHNGIPTQWEYIAAGQTDVFCSQQMNWDQILAFKCYYAFEMDSPVDKKVAFP